MQQSSDNLFIDTNTLLVYKNLSLDQVNRMFAIKHTGLPAPGMRYGIRKHIVITGMVISRMHAHLTCSIELSSMQPHTILLSISGKVEP